jgi:hypothetical protein
MTVLLMNQGLAKLDKPVRVVLHHDFKGQTQTKEIVLAPGETCLIDIKNLKYAEIFEASG